MKKLSFLIIVIIYPLMNCFSQNYLGGDITYKRLSDFQYESTLILYTSLNGSINAPDSLQINTGDGYGKTAHRTDSADLCAGILKNKYTTVHTYLGAGNYVISFEDTLQNYNFANCPGCNLFYLQSLLVISPWGGGASSNLNSVFFDADPIFFADSGKVFKHNLTAIDLDGDSLSYNLLDLDIIPSYWIPDSMTINKVSGEIIWKNPDTIGTFQFYAKVEEWRKTASSQSILVGSVIRNFTIKVDNLNNVNYFGEIGNWNVNLSGDYEYHLLPGTNLQLFFTYNDSLADSLNVAAYGEIFNIVNAASFNTLTGSGQNYGLFSWTPDNSNVRNHPYIVTFRGKSYLDTICVEKDITIMIYVDAVTSIDEQTNIDKQIMIYPNPTNGLFTLEINQNSNSDIDVRIYNLLGELVYTETAKNQTGITKRQIDISGFGKGMYLVQVQAGESRVSKKVVYR